MNTPKANRKHIVFYGKRNAGKSSIMNGLIGQEISLVSEIKGTTTDTVSKAVELISFGPVVFVDTGGIDDEGLLGELRVEKTRKTLENADLAIYVIDIQDLEDIEFEMEKEFIKRDIPYIVVINKIDLISKDRLRKIEDRLETSFGNKQVVFTSVKDNGSIENLRDKLIKRLEYLDEDDTLIGDIVPYNGKILMVVPLDKEAPKGRLILPQVQLIRDCLDHGIKSYVVRDTELRSAINDLEDIDLVVTDSQIFKYVESVIPQEISLTSFSILMARQKGDLKEFIYGIEKLKNLKSIGKPKILIMESCSHNVSHEDIGRVKIPRVVNNFLGKEIQYDFAMGNDFPQAINEYDLVIHCGSCMLNKKTMMNRIRMSKEAGVPITNYGMVLAHGAGILNRAVDVFK
ncbi:MAG: [FeFe] hydrogenase H-cluster maturation GTPase HydF [Tissierellaceae bacterium]|nr:[FeFe] hydrogenase H-cluster maturation GTPase HydF [Tissierellaceae bacterium]